MLPDPRALAKYALHPALVTTPIGALLGAGTGYLTAPDDPNEQRRRALIGAGGGALAGLGLGSAYERFVLNPVQQLSPAQRARTQRHIAETRQALQEVRAILPSEAHGTLPITPEVLDDMEKVVLSSTKHALAPWHITTPLGALAGGAYGYTREPDDPDPTRRALRTGLGATAGAGLGLVGGWGLGKALGPSAPRLVPDEVYWKERHQKLKDQAELLEAQRAKRQAQMTDLEQQTGELKDKLFNLTPEQVEALRQNPEFQTELAKLQEHSPGFGSPDEIAEKLRDPNHVWEF